MGIFLRQTHPPPSTDAAARAGQGRHSSPRLRSSDVYFYTQRGRTAPVTRGGDGEWNSAAVLGSGWAVRVYLYSLATAAATALLALL